VARQLRERVIISTSADLSASIPNNWQRQSATAFGFDRIYVAALRSVGIPARLNQP
jgi:hypothetical protein